MAMRHARGLGREGLGGMDRVHKIEAAILVRRRQMRRGRKLLLMEVRPWRCGCVRWSLLMGRRLRLIVAVIHRGGDGGDNVIVPGHPEVATIPMKCLLQQRTWPSPCESSSLRPRGASNAPDGWQTAGRRRRLSSTVQQVPGRLFQGGTGPPGPYLA